MARLYRDIESSTITHRRYPISRRIIRWIALGTVIVTSIWLLHPYFPEYWYERAGLPDYLQDWPLDPIVGEDKSSDNVTAGLEKLPSHIDDEAVNVRPPDWSQRKEQVKNAFKHALTGYMEHAFPNDELAPLYRGFINHYNGWGVSVFDSLDTMWIMGLHDVFDQAMEHVARQTFTLLPGNYMPFFETTIRYLGGLLSAYALSGNTVLLSRADDLGQKLLPAFNAMASGFPAYAVHPQTGETRFGVAGPMILFAEAASCQLEFKYLAKLTGRAEYYEKVENVMSVIYKADVNEGLFPELWNARGEPSGTHFTAGSGADSGYEYLLKQYLLTGDVHARDQYIKSANGIINNLLYVSPKRQLLYATDLRGTWATDVYEHLTCFLPGLLALGAQTLDLPPLDKQIHEWAAKGLAYTCYLMYADQETGLSPDSIEMNKGGRKWVDVLKEWEDGGGDGRQGDVPPGLREPPKTTKGVSEWKKGREYSNLSRRRLKACFYYGRRLAMCGGWEIFESIEKYSRTDYGYANVASVDWDPYAQEDEMPSWFLAETLKYLYLLFDDTDPIPLDKWVFNTEAHPLPVFRWTTWERQSYNISY
ncbi:hypothetical protein AX17_005895 [Amanita inopinata Kibby_2008]|nr:hypothetical protein AX17_005895 [Amanita inopinata Kibby_2008]